MIDPRKLRLRELCQLLNSTPLGEVIQEHQLQRHRTRAGFRLGEGRHIDLLRYLAWLLQVRHVPQPAMAARPMTEPDLAEAAQGAAAWASRRASKTGNPPKLTPKQEALIAALLTEPTHAAAANKAGISVPTLYRWLRQPQFRAVYDQAGRDLAEVALGRMRAATGQSVDTLLTVARQGRRDSDRVRAANTLLGHVFRTLQNAGILRQDHQPGDATPLATGDLVALLTIRLREIDQAELPLTEKSHLTTKLSDALLRVLSMDTLEKRLAVLEAVMIDSKQSHPG